MIRVKPARLLIIPGVDFGMLAAKDPPDEPPQFVRLYDDIPRRFVGAESWPKTSNRKCCTCDLYPTSYPKFVPENLVVTMRGGKKRIEADVLGHFDEWNCAQRWIEHELPEQQREDATKALLIVEECFSHSRKQRILPSPPKMLMRPYAGDGGLSEAEYRKKIRELNENYTLGSYSILDHSISFDSRANARI